MSFIRLNNAPVVAPLFSFPPWYLRNCSLRVSVATALTDEHIWNELRGQGCSDRCDLSTCVISLHLFARMQAESKCHKHLTSGIFIQTSDNVFLNVVFVLYGQLTPIKHEMVQSKPKSFFSTPIVSGVPEPHLKQSEHKQLKSNFKIEI